MDEGYLALGHPGGGINRRVVEKGFSESLRQGYVVPGGDGGQLRGARSSTKRRWSRPNGPGELQEQVQRLEEAVKDLKPPLRRTEKLAEDLKQQVELLAANYKRSPKYWAGLNTTWKRRRWGRFRRRSPDQDYGPSR